jgi:hypothetical protein
MSFAFVFLPGLVYYEAICALGQTGNSMKVMRRTWSFSTAVIVIELSSDFSCLSETSRSGVLYYSQRLPHEL